ncbi:hypothetical protein Y032_0019g3793 [Ancylostoma ceylanicum]|uniref:Uncharacterized protein n=1 Tax=Ancylostoma ceylanicum TaxID=53326 RepID=A0A016V3T1_9BILA|nr:hypothetical protein Y032_0019g3793 [Ancylostoma ceylanicum]
MFRTTAAEDKLKEQRAKAALRTFLVSARDFGGVCFDIHKASNALEFVRFPGMLLVSNYNDSSIEEKRRPTTGMRIYVYPA